MAPLKKAKVSKTGLKLPLHFLVKSGLITEKGTWQDSLISAGLFGRATTGMPIPASSGYQSTNCTGDSKPIFFSQTSFNFTIVVAL